MGLFEHFPYTNFQDLNIDWILQEIKKNSADVESMREYLDSLNIEQVVDDKITEMIDDGSFAAFISNYFSLYLTPEMFGAVGDGVTDDSAAFTAMFEQGGDYRLYWLADKTYNISGLTATVKLPLIGNGASLLLGSGQLLYEKRFESRGITYHTTSGTAISFTSPYYADSFILTNCVFVSDNATNTARSGVCARPRAKIVDISDVVCKGFRNAIIFNNSNEVTGTEQLAFKNICGINCETLIDIEGAPSAPYTDYVSNIVVDGVLLVNTAEQKASVTGSVVGKDAVLIGGVNTFSVSNVVSLYAPERAVYINCAKNGTISNVIAVGSEGVKLAGVTTSGVKVKSEKVRISDVSVYPENATGCFTLYLYDVENVDVSDISMIGNGSNVNTDPMIELSRYVHGLRIKGVYCKDIGRSVVAAFDTAGTATDLADIVITDVDAYDCTRYTAYHAFRFVQTTRAKDIVFRNISINAGKDVYDASTNLSGVFSMQHVDNFTAENVSAYGFAVTTDPMSFSDCTNVRITKTRLWCLSTAIMAPPSVYTDDSDLVYFTYANNSQYKYKCEMHIGGAVPTIHADVIFPCARNISGDHMTNRTIIISGETNGALKIVSGTPTVLYGSGFSYSSGIISGTGAAKIDVLFT